MMNRTASGHPVSDDAPDRGRTLGAEAEPRGRAQTPARAGRRAWLAAGLGAAGTAVWAEGALAASRRSGPAVSARTATPLTVVYGGGDIGALPVWMAGRLGYFRSEGLDVRVVKAEWNANPSPDTLLNTGRAQFLTISMDMLESDFQCCDASTTPGHAVYVAAPIPVAIFTLVGSGAVRRVADLRGRVVGVPGELASAAHFDLELALRRAGLELSDVHLSNGRASKDVFAQLQSGVLGGAMLPPPMSVRAVQLGFHRLADPAAYGEPYPSAWLATDRRWAAAHDETALSFMRAFVRGLRATRAAADEAAAAIMSATGIGQRDVALATYRECVEYLTEQPVVPLAGVEAALTMLARYHPTVASAVRAADPRQFVDATLLQRAM